MAAVNATVHKSLGWDKSYLYPGRGRSFWDRVITLCPLVQLGRASSYQPDRWYFETGLKYYIVSSTRRRKLKISLILRCDWKIMKYRLLLTLALFDYYTRLGSYKSSIYINNSRYGMFYSVTEISYASSFTNGIFIIGEFKSHSLRKWFNYLVT